MEEPKGTAKRRAKTAAAAQEDKITLLPLSELHDFPNHPFKVRDDEAMQETAESIRQYGVLVPAIVRPREDGGYEIIAGHRRRHGSELAGLSAMPCIVRQMDDDTATILMVDSNIQRENILPSERAQAHKMKLEDIKRQGARTDLTSPQVVLALNSRKSAFTFDQRFSMGFRSGLYGGRKIYRTFASSSSRFIALAWCDFILSITITESGLRYGSKSFSRYCLNFSTVVPPEKVV